MLELTTWMRALDEARAQTVVEVPGGIAVRHSAYPHAHDHNKLIITAPCDAVALADAADNVLADASHRHIDVLLGAEDVAPALLSRGYEREDGVLMELSASGARSALVSAVSLEERCSTGAAEWAAHRPSMDPETCRQLGDRMRTAASWATFLAVHAPEGHVASRVDLHQRGEIAQIEDLMTLEPYRGRGYASALVLDAAARAAGARRVFLHADAHDWPRVLYARLGFVEVGVVASFTRSARPVA